MMIFKTCWCGGKGIIKKSVNKNIVVCFCEKICKKQWETKGDRDALKRGIFCLKGKKGVKATSL